MGPIWSGLCLASQSERASKIPLRLVEVYKPEAYQKEEEEGDGSRVRALKALNHGIVVGNLSYRLIGLY